MSLDPHWYSTIFGVLTLGGQGLSTLAFTIIVLASLVKFARRKSEHAKVPKPLRKHRLRRRSGRPTRT